MTIGPWQTPDHYRLTFPLWRCRECDNSFLVREQTAPPVCCNRRMAFWRPERLRELAK